MKVLLEEFGGTVIAAIVCLLLLGFSMTAYMDEDKGIGKLSDKAIRKENIEIVTDTNELESLKDTQKPTITASSGNLDINEVFKIPDYIEATSNTGTDITSQVKIVNITPSTGNKSSINGKYELDTSRAGVYTLKFMVSDNGVTSYAEATYIID